MALQVIERIHDEEPNSFLKIEIGQWDGGIKIGYGQKLKGNTLFCMRDRNVAACYLKKVCIHRTVLPCTIYDCVPGHFKIASQSKDQRCYFVKCYYRESLKVMSLP